MKRNFDRIIFWLFGFLAYSSGNAEENSHSPVKKWEDVAFVSHPTGELATRCIPTSDSKEKTRSFVPAWRILGKGFKEVYASPCRRFSGKGYVAVCSNYRLTDVAPAPAQLHDVFSAIRFLRRKCLRVWDRSSKDRSDGLIGWWISRCDGSSI